MVLTVLQPMTRLRGDLVSFFWVFGREILWEQILTMFTSSSQYVPNNISFCFAMVEHEYKL
jgi:hypothetical protein